MIVVCVILERDQCCIGRLAMKNFGVLPVPPVYVIDRSGKVTFSFVEVDYRIRLPAEDLLAGERGR